MVGKVKRPAVQEQNRRAGDKREARLRKDPASRRFAPARGSSSAHWSTLIGGLRTRLAQGPCCHLWPGQPAPIPGSGSSRGLNAQLSAGPGRALSTALSLSSLRPSWASRAQALHCCAPVAAMLGPCGGGVGGRRGSGPHLAQRNTCTPPTGGAREHDLEQADPSVGHQCPDTQQDSKAKQEAAPRQGKSLQLSRITEQVPARQTKDCLQGERKATSCLRVSGKGWS